MKLFIVLQFLMLASTAVSAADVVSWPSTDKQIFISGCREAIWVNVERDFMLQHKLEGLPTGFREKAAEAIEPFLAVCDCMTNEYEKRWTYEYFTTHQDEVAAAAAETLLACPVSVSVDE